MKASLIIYLEAQLIDLLWTLNLDNFMDVIDGLSAAVAIFLCASSILLLVLSGDLNLVWIYAALLACVAGFLVWNWPPAKIFMVNVGSSFIEYVLGVSALVSAKTQDVPIFGLIIVCCLLF